MQINNKKIIITVLLIVGFIIALSIYMIYTNNSNEIDLANMIMQEEIIENDTDNLVTNSTGEEAKMIIHISGEVKNPGIVTIKLLCDGLGISLAEFFDAESFHSTDPQIQ